MTRIIAGLAGSIVLEVPAAGTRPTSDRVRESLFGALESIDAVRGAAVLDLYAGSGALGLEAASRGAASVDLIDSSPQAVAACRRNAARTAKALGDAAAMRVHAVTVPAYLRTARGPYDLVLVDPPYELAQTELAHTLEAVAGLLSPRAWVVVERATRSGPPPLPQGMTLPRTKRYGDTSLWWLAPAGQPDARSQSR